MEDDMMHCAHDDDLGYYTSYSDWRDLVVDGWQTTRHQLPHHSDIWPILTYNTHNDQIPGITRASLSCVD
jgi:hypothetical protein